MTVAVIATGVGTYALAAIPVAYLHNNAAFHGASSVVAHFSIHRTGRTLGSLDAVPVNLAPGETLAVTADCTDACNGATSVGVTVTVGAWATLVGPVFATVPAAYSCGPCHAGHGFGDARGMLRPSSPIAQGTAVVGFATCRNRAGTILGGGSAEIVWQAGATLAIDVPVVLNAAPASCSLGASTRWQGASASFAPVARTRRGCGRVGLGSGAGCRRDVSLQGAGGVEPASPGTGKPPGARPKTGVTRCICPNGHVASFSAAS
jgi:hypothetical protein